MSEVGTRRADVPERVAAAVRALVINGVEAGPAVRRFIESAFLNPTAADLQALLEAEAAEAGAPLLELLFSPDEEQQAAIEPLLPDKGLTATQEAALMDGLCRPPLEVAFRLSPAEGRLVASATPALARRFVSALNTVRPVPGALAQAIDSGTDPAQGARLRVCVRNSRVRWTPAKAAAAAAYVRAGGSRGPEGLSCFKTVLEILAEPDTGAELFAVFAGRRQALALALERDRRQARLLARANIETLASSGVRMAAIDAADTRRRMACIDRFTLAAFGRVGDSAPPPTEAGAALAPDSVEELVRLLDGGDPESV